MNLPLPCLIVTNDENCFASFFPSEIPSMDPSSPTVDDYENRLQIFSSSVKTSRLYVCRWSQSRTVLILRAFSTVNEIQLRVIGRGNAIIVFYDAYRLRI